MANGIIKMHGIDKVVFGEDVVAYEAPRLALSGHETEPGERPVGSIHLVTPILHVIPQAHETGEQLVADSFIVLDDVKLPTILDPPVAMFKGDMAAVWEVLAGLEHLREGWWGKGFVSMKRILR